jgi:CRISPR/Cas system-associated endonuclease Cas1
VIGADGFVSLAALRWPADQDAAFVMIERDGSVLASTGPAPGLDDARLRRAQALALRSGTGLEIARELIDKKLDGQEQVSRDKLHNAEAANSIARFRKALATARTFEAIGDDSSRENQIDVSALHAESRNFPGLLPYGRQQSVCTG